MPEHNIFQTKSNLMMRDKTSAGSETQKQRLRYTHF